MKIINVPTREEVSENNQRESVYAKLLGTKVLESYFRNNLILTSHLVAFTAFNYLLKEVSTEKVSTSAYVNPVIALILGWYILDEQITTQSIVAAIILLTGVYFINSKRNAKTKLHGR